MQLQLVFQQAQQPAAVRKSQSPGSPDKKAKKEGIIMTREEYNTKAGELMTAISAEEIDTGKVSEIAAEMREAFQLEVTRAETAEKTAEDLKRSNESLQAANMNLFLKSGEIIKAAEQEKTPPEVDKPFDFNTLFNEKGELI